MGMFRISSSTIDSSRMSNAFNPDRSNYNPDPSNFIIMIDLCVGNFLIIMVAYPNCTNFEGRKILVFKDTTLSNLTRQGKIDPHFSDNEKYIHPIARFVPTGDGWNMAVKLCETLSKEN